MSLPETTPGPWHVENYIHVKAENGWRVATVNVPSGSVGSWGITPVAQAGLIAAAPSMHEALTKIAAFDSDRASVQIARECLAQITSLPSGSIER